MKKQHEKRTARVQKLCGGKEGKRGQEGPGMGRRMNKQMDPTGAEIMCIDIPGHQDSPY